MTEKKTIPNKSVGHCRNQYYAVCAANLIVFSQGCIFGWIPPILPLWKSENTPLTTGPMSVETISWVVSMGSIGSLSAAFVFRSITSHLGCKRTMTSCLTTLSIIAWLLFAFGRTKNEVLIARFLAGAIGAGLESVVLMFVAEIADNRVRGALGSVSTFVRLTGSLIALIVATYADYSAIPFFFIGFPVLFFIIFLWMPNTAPYLIRTGKHEEAKKSIRFYKGLTDESVETTAAVNQEYERLLSVAAFDTPKSESMTMQKLRRPDVYRGMLIGIGLTFLNQYCGSFVLSVYSVGIFQESGTRIDPYVSTIILGILQVAGTLSSTSLVDTFGRKPLLTISMAGCALGLSAMTSFIYLHHLGYDLTIVDWIPVVSSGFVIFISFVGIQSLTMLCIVESLPAEARSFGLAISIMTNNVFSFCSSKFFPILAETIQLHGVILMYAIISGIGTVFVAVMIKETKGKSLDDIVDKAES